MGVKSTLYKPRVRMYSYDTFYYTLDQESLIGPLISTIYFFKLQSRLKLRTLQLKNKSIFIRKKLFKLIKKILF